jgi:hypothetical protein
MTLVRARTSLEPASASRLSRSASLSDKWDSQRLKRWEGTGVGKHRNTTRSQRSKERYYPDGGKLGGGGQRESHEKIRHCKWYVDDIYCKAMVARGRAEKAKMYGVYRCRYHSFPSSTSYTVPDTWKAFTFSMINQFWYRY